MQSSPQWLYGCFRPGCRVVERAKSLDERLLLRLRAPLEGRWVPRWYACLRAGFRDVDPEHLDIAQSSLTQGLAQVVYTTTCCFSTTDAVNSTTCHDPGASTRMVKSVFVTLSKALLTEQLLCLGRLVAAPQISNVVHTYARRQEKICKIHVALRPLQICMDVVQLLFIR